MFEGNAPGDPARCPVDGCGFAGAVGQVVAHVADADDAAHDRAARRVESAADAGEEETDVEAVLRLLREEHGTADAYESDGRGCSLFPFD